VPWIELLLAYERYEVDGEQHRSINVISEYDSTCLCGGCCEEMLILLPEDSDDQALMYRWVAGIVQLLGGEAT